MGYVVNTMISKEELARGIERVAELINRDYAGKEVHLICVLKGGAYFMTELSKHLTIPTTIDFMSVSSYGSGTVSSGIVKIIKDLDEPIENKNVIIVEDIIDTGYTLTYLIGILKARKPASLKVCTMLSKPSRRVVPLNADYCAFEVEDKFVVGYGLDFDQKYRNLPYIGAVEESDEE